MSHHDSDVDADYSDSEFNSAPTTPLVNQKYQHRQGILSPKSTDRLYSLAALNKTHFSLDTEHAPLLASGRDAVRSYNSTSPEGTSMEASIASLAPPLGMLTRKISRVFQSKAYDYDSNKHALAAVG